MRILVFDTETTGLPQTKHMNPDTLALWPHIVQFSYIIYDTDANDIVQTFDNIVKIQEGIVIPEESIKFHSITNEISTAKGVELELILNEFFEHLNTADTLVGHNISFDINMIKIELLRLIYANSAREDLKTHKYNLHYLNTFANISCTLMDSIKLCNIKALSKSGKPYTKFPKLIELHQKLFETAPNHLHNSFNDILVTLRCFMQMKHNIDLNSDCDAFKKLACKNNIF